MFAMNDRLSYSGIVPSLYSACSLTPSLGVLRAVCGAGDHYLQRVSAKWRAANGQRFSGWSESDRGFWSAVIKAITAGDGAALFDC